MLSINMVGGVAVSVLVLSGWLLRARRRRAGLQELRGKVVLITGASSGLGEACARAFYLAGCRLILCARRTDELQRVARQLKEMKSLPEAITYEPKVLTVDISQLSLIPAVMETAVGYYGYIDVVINNAGSSYRGEIIQTSLDVDVSLMNVNYFGHVALTKAILPATIARKSGGHLVYVSSVQGKLSIPLRSAYSASKHALQSFCDCLRAEVSPHNILVTVVSPAYIKTGLSLNALTADGSKYGVMDETQKKGMEPDYVAKKILESVALQCSDVILAPYLYRLVVYLRNILPDLIFTIMAFRAKKQMKKTN